MRVPIIRWMFITVYTVAFALHYMWDHPLECLGDVALGHICELSDRVAFLAYRSLQRNAFYRRLRKE